MDYRKHIAEKLTATNIPAEEIEAAIAVPRNGRCIRRWCGGSTGWESPIF